MRDCGYDGGNGGMLKCCRCKFCDEVVGGGFVVRQWISSPLLTTRTRKGEIETGGRGFFKKSDRQNTRGLRGIRGIRDGFDIIRALLIDKDCAKC
jgi:hypothetical protein